MFIYNLKISNEKFVITRRLYNELIAQTNLIGDYNKCRVYVRKSLDSCKREVKKVYEFENKKIDFEI